MPYVAQILVGRDGLWRSHSGGFITQWFFSSLCQNQIVAVVDLP